MTNPPDGQSGEAIIHQSIQAARNQIQARLGEITPEQEAAYIEIGRQIFSRHPFNRTTTSSPSVGESGTPRTDAVCEIPSKQTGVSLRCYTKRLSNLARDLERENQQLRANALWSITCVHHTDAERAALPVVGNCPVCAQRENQRLAGELERMTERRKPAMQWQPINSAPTDGTVVLGRLPDSDIPQSIVFLDGAWCVQWDHHRLSKFDQPTHWISLSNL